MNYMQSDYGMSDFTTIFDQLLENVIALPFDDDTKHDIKNLVTYMMMRKLEVRS